VGLENLKFLDINGCRAWKIKQKGVLRSMTLID